MADRIDVNEPLQFENGEDAYVVGVIGGSGSLYKPFYHSQDYAEAYAELYEQGVRYMVATDQKAHSGGCIDEYGQPVAPYDCQYFPTRKPVINRKIHVDMDGMDDSALFGMF